MMIDLKELMEDEQTFYSAPADTNFATIYTCEALWGRMLSLSICTNGASTVTVVFNNGSDRNLLYNYVVPANSHTTRDFGRIVLRNGHTVKVKTDNADDTFFTLVIGEGRGQK